MLVEILAHPNTPAYMQAVAIFFAAWWGGRKVVGYISQRRADKEFEVANKAFIGCCKAYDILAGVKSSHIFNRERFESFKRMPTHFGEMYKLFAEGAISQLDTHKDFFQEDLYTAFAETRLYFGDEKVVPLETFLTVRNRLYELLNSIVTTSSYLVREGDHRDLVGDNIDNAMNTVEDAVVQIWETVELSERQRERERQEGRLYQGLDKMLKEALKQARQIYPAIIPKK